MQKYCLFIALFIFSSISLSGQSIIDIASFTFNNLDSCELKEPDSGLSNTAPFYEDGSLDCACGVNGDALRLTEDDQIIFLGDVKDLFRKQDFTVSFYMKIANESINGTMQILSNTDTCSNENLFSIRYTPAFRQLDVFIVEDNENESSLSAELPEDACWHHVVVTRQIDRARLYINGELVVQRQSLARERVDLENDDFGIYIGRTQCTDGVQLTGFDGFLDELQFLQGGWTSDQARLAYLAPEKIGNGKFSLGTKDTTIFLGGQVEAFITSKCPEVDILWTPSDGITTANNIEDPILMPEQTTTYAANFSDQFCESTDSITINVIDPNTLDCTALFIPKAFTPNDDGLNDLFGISNAVVMTNFSSFEIFDRWGNRVFVAEDRNAQWDGTYRGDPVNGNVFLYKVLYECKGEEIAQTGSVTIIR